VITDIPTCFKGSGKITGYQAFRCIRRCTYHYGDALFGEQTDGALAHAACYNEFGSTLGYPRGKQPRLMRRGHYVFPPDNIL
jgi:hypothetical protein